MSGVLTPPSVAKAYGRRTVLRDVTFDVARAEVVGLIGPNGAGKTTLLRIGLGLQRPDAGRVLVDGLAARTALRRIKVGYFAGEFTVPPTVRTRQWRHLFQETDVSAENRPVHQLSRGTRQLLGLRAVLGLPALRLLVLDEPWEGLDPDAARWLSDAIRLRRASGAAVLVSSHRLHDLAGVCDRFVFLDHGVVSVMSSRDVQRGGALTGEMLLDAFDHVRRAER